MSNIDEKNENNENNQSGEAYSLNDDRRVKVLSPGALVMKRFIRNRMAVVGMTVLIFMFLFSFVGGLLSPYGQNQFFYREEAINREFAAVTENTELRYMAKDSSLFGPAVQAQVILALQKGTEGFDYHGMTYEVKPEGEDFYSISADGDVIGIAFKDVVNSAVEGQNLDFDFVYAALTAYANGDGKDADFEVNGEKYTVDTVGNISADGKEVAYASKYIIQPIMGDVFLSRDFKEQVLTAIQNGETEFSYTDQSLVEAGKEDAADTQETAAAEDENNILSDDDVADELAELAAEGEDEAAASATAEYLIKKNQNHESWSIWQEQTSYQYDSYSYPSRAHLLGTDKYGMDMLTRLMYGGRVSLMIGFIVVFIETFLGVIMGGISGYFGGWVDNLIMRLVDIFYCIPSMPIIIILGAAMDAQRVDPTLRMIYLMLILGVLGWAGIARLVRGQILSLREQEFMTATEACGIGVRHRIFRHLIPNVIPQLIVNCTMSLGGVIITEATLSFLGLGVKFPFASWGNIINDVNNTHVLTTYWFIWIPAGILLLLTVLAFNLVGDGLRDAFDPKMKR